MRRHFSICPVKLDGSRRNCYSWSSNELKVVHALCLGLKLELHSSDLIKAWRTVTDVKRWFDGVAECRWCLVLCRWGDQLSQCWLFMVLLSGERRWWFVDQDEVVNSSDFRRFDWCVMAWIRVVSIQWSRFGLRTVAEHGFSWWSRQWRIVAELLSYNLYGHTKPIHILILKRDNVEAAWAWFLWCSCKLKSVLDQIIVTNKARNCL